METVWEDHEKSVEHLNTKFVMAGIRTGRIYYFTFFFKPGQLLPVFIRQDI
jgi:hypothetical protein